MNPEIIDENLQEDLPNNIIDVTPQAQHALVPQEQRGQTAAQAALQSAEDLAKIHKRLEEVLANTRAESTKHTYRTAWKYFELWCQQHHLSALPATSETICLYMTDLVSHRGRKLATAEKILVAISQYHQWIGLEPPTRTISVRHCMSGLRRSHGVAQERKRPLLPDDLRIIVESMPDTLIGWRNRALFLLAFAGAFRRSEVIDLRVEDVEVCKEGLIVFLRKSKTDQEMAGRKIGIPYGAYLETCPVRNYQAWLEKSAIHDGFIFRRIHKSGKILPDHVDDAYYAMMLKQSVIDAGLDVDVNQISGHSMRSGLVTAATLAGKSEQVIMKQTGHRSSATLQRYIRDANLFRQNAAAGIGL